MAHHTGSEHAQTTMGTGTFPVDNITYDLISSLHSKLEAIEVYQKYLKDAQGDEECSKLFRELLDQDRQASNRLLDALTKHVQHRGGKAH